MEITTLQAWNNMHSSLFDKETSPDNRRGSFDYGEARSTTIMTCSTMNTMCPSSLQTQMNSKHQEQIALEHMLPYNLP